MQNPASPAGHRTFDFLELPAVARDAFARAINEKRAPLVRRAGGGHVLSAIAGAVVLGAVLIWGFGGQDESLVSQAPELIAWYAVGFAGLVGSVLLYRRHEALARLFGCAPGVYALGTRMIDARSRKVRVYDLLAVDPRIVHHYVNGGYRGTSLTWHGFRFSYSRRDAPEQVLSALNAQLRVLRDAASTRDIERMLAIDPIAIGLAMTSTAATAPSAPPTTSRRALVLAAIVTLGLAGSTWCGRNYASMEAAFQNIRSADDVEIWVRNGGDAARGSNKKMEIELTQAVSFDADNAGKLRDVLARYPDAPDELKKPALVALEKRYQAARAAALALSSSEPLTAFINQVYDHLEANGVAAVMQVEVARTDNSALTRFDDEIAADGPSSARVVPVATYFDPSEDASPTQALKTAVQSGLGQFFPKDVMVFSDTANEHQAKITIFYVIRLQISSDDGVTMYREVDANHRPVPGSVEYPGVEFELGATLEVPGEQQPQRVTFVARPAPSITVKHAAQSSYSGAHDSPSSLDNSSVYHAMADSAFADLQPKLVRALGGKPEIDEPSAAPRDPACAELESSLRKLAACPSVARTDGKKLSTELDKLTNAQLDDHAFCTRGGDLAHRLLVRSKCE